uniref:Uncharacterized protein n=1 Tax=Anopheles atroparvus TaxID=41427 RepID=A0AAG5CS38_ANOAO
ECGNHVVRFRQQHNRKFVHLQAAAGSAAEIAIKSPFGRINSSISVDARQQPISENAIP